MWTNFLNFFFDMFKVLQGSFTSDGLFHLMPLDSINMAIKVSFLGICTYKVFYKINGHRNIDLKITMSIISSILFAVFFAFLRLHLDLFTSVSFLFLLHWFFILAITKRDFRHSMLTVAFSFVVSVFAYFLAIFFAFFASQIIHFNIAGSGFRFLIAGIFQYGMIDCLFAVKRFRNGFQFLQYTPNINIFASFFSAITFILLAIILFFVAILTYCRDVGNNLKTLLLATILIIGLNIIFLIYKVLKSYYRVQLMQNTLKSQEEELQEKDESNKKLSEENDALASLIHKYSSRLAAIEEFVKTSNSSKKKYALESSKEFSGILDDIKRLSNQFSSNVQANMKDSEQLPLTKVLGIDILLKHLAKEANKSNIKFDLKISSNIDYMLENYIDQDQFETLLSDLIRNAIIAINCKKTSDGGILVIMGKLKNAYGLCVYDNGVEFEIDALMHLGLNSIHRRSEITGSGIGFKTTFATLSETKASLIIDEKNSDLYNFTKSISIIFDNKKEFRICSYRADELAKNNKGNRIIISPIW